MRKFISLLAGIAFATILQAQSNPIIKMDVYLKPIYGDSISPQMFVELDDTLLISEIDVKLGTTETGAEIFQKSFEFNTNGEFEDGTTYVREGNVLRMDLGRYLGFSTCFATVRLQYSNGTFSSPVSFNQ
ncbi:MAG: hypothetical protein M0D57_10475 [Sphingobacteriales bacterium JAD_PAG50586_3]|nr:MAG: hypothetical protein M0D57_10475 [Sphingobacteriales bacterium JAD_PAG50586_3]